MLYANDGHSARAQVDAGQTMSGEAAGAVWLDLCDPTEGERSAVERVTGLRVPAQAALAEIESSSRLLTEADTLYLSMPMIHPAVNGETAVAPLGFVLSPGRLITARFAAMPVFDDYAARFAGAPQPSSAGAFVGLLEAIVDRLADVLERVGADLEAISRQIFRGPATAQAKSSKIDAELRATLRAIGGAGARLANLRDSLLGVRRIVAYVHDAGADWFEKVALHRCSTLRADVASLMEYDVQLSDKVQFLLDATLGFISIEQNNAVKVLTVVSVVGVPPTLVASIYGMNFKWIPELQWDYGYFYGLALMVVTAVLPLIWFKRRGWI